MRSYCRWSSENYTCDLYVYLASDGNYVTHVAAKRVVKAMDFPTIDLSSVTTIYESCIRQRDALSHVIYEPIGLPYDGHSFTNDNLTDLLQTLIMLKKIGYNIPKNAFLAIIRDIKREPPEPIVLF